MRWRERILGWVVVGLVLCGLAMPVVGQEEEIDPDAARVMEIYRSLAASGQYVSDVELVKAWVDALEQELGAEHQHVRRALFASGQAFYQQGQYHEALPLFERLVQSSEEALGRQDQETLAFMSWLAKVYGRLGRPNDAQGIEEELLFILRSLLGEEHHSTLAAKANLAATMRANGDLSGARILQEETLQGVTNILGEEHPDALTTKASLGLTLRALGDLSAAHQYQEEVLEVRTRTLGPHHPITLMTAHNLADVLRELGHLVKSRELFEEVLEAQDRVLGEEHQDAVYTRANLAITLRKLGDLASARELQDHVVRTFSRIFGPEHPESLTAKQNLAALLYEMGEYYEARRLYQEVYGTLERDLGENHLHTLAAKHNLANTLHAEGRLAKARQLLEEVTTNCQQTLGKDHPDTLSSSISLAAIHRAFGEYTAASERIKEVLEVCNRILGKDHPLTLNTRSALAEIFFYLGELDKAENIYNDLVAHYNGVESSKLKTLQEAFDLFNLALIQRHRGDLAAAHNNFVLGLDALETQILRIDFSESAKIRYKERFALAYADTLITSLARVRFEEALQVLERYRTQSLMNLLYWNHLGDGADVSDALRAERAEIAHRYDWLTREIDSAYPSPAPALLKEQAQVRRRREVIQGQIINMRRAEVGVLDRIDIDAICQTLDSGTVLLAYSIGQEESFLFVLTLEHGVQVHSIAVDTESLERQITRLREIDIGQKSVSSESRQGLSQWLYEKLLKQAEPRLDVAQRVVILPDGPLYYLPFSALTRKFSSSRIEVGTGGWQYLAEWKPFHIVQSATVYAKLQAKRPERGNASEHHTWQWVGFGEPVYPEDTKKSETKPAHDKPTSGKRSSAVLRSTEERGIWQQEDLPYTGQEIRAISERFPEGQAKVFLGRDANEDRVREMLASARIVHLAAHGVDDPDYPLDSLIALSLLESDELEHNGLLQAWEIIDQLELNADLVVLSACETALGPNRGGEGLISLSRAFQIAGARSVLASLWAVNDRSTSELMIRFYRHLLAGETKDRAIQLAQIELIRGPVEIVNENGETETHDFSAPYYWAAFQLIGDWK